jgi:purine catabolism regulator
MIDAPAHRGTDGLAGLGPSNPGHPSTLERASALLADALLAHPSRCAALASVLDPLVAHDQRRRTKLLTTLEAFARADFSSRRASARLHVHRHTVDNRIQRIEKILGGSVRSGKGRVLVELALLARRVQLGSRVR